MDIQYLGHSCFRIKGKTGTVVTDPYSSSVGYPVPSVSADVVTISHMHDDHNNLGSVSGTSRRNEPFIIGEPGEYEVEGISVFGYRTYHDDKEGGERGENTIYAIQVDGVRVLHLGDLGHMLSDKLLGELDSIDVVMVPVGGVYTIGASRALELIDAISPYIAIPMHYKTERHDVKLFGEMATLADFLKEYGGEARKVEDKLAVSKISLSEESTEVVVFE